MRTVTTEIAAGNPPAPNLSGAEIRSAPAPLAFVEAWAAYVHKWNAANAFFLLNYPGDDGDLSEFEPVFDEFALDCFRAARAALLAPAQTVDELRKKLIIIEQQEPGAWSELGDVFIALAADAQRFAGGEA